MSRRPLSAELDALLERISPQRIGEECDLRIGGAVDEFLYGQPALMTQWPVFKECITKFYHMLESRLCGLPQDLATNDEIDFGRAIHVLMDQFGGNGEKAAFIMAQTGAEGGLRFVLNTMAEAMAKDFEERFIKIQIGRWWQELSPDEWLEVTRDYVKRYGHLWPKEMVEANGVMLCVNFPKTLLQHARRLRELRRGRR